jgi:hypothetical protein
VVGKIYEIPFMSEKHLTELPWKTIVLKQGVKDLGLGKALAAYGCLDLIKEPAKALESLQQISELAVKLKKANAKNADLVAYLDEMVKELKKTTPAMEARAKAAGADTTRTGSAKTPIDPKARLEEEGDEDEDEEKVAASFKKDLKQQMVSALAQVKARAPGDPGQQKEPKPQLQFMACLTGNNCSVIVARKVGAATKKLLLELAGVTGGAKFVQGECLFEKNTHTFVLDQVPAGLAKKLATSLHAETGQKYKVRVRNTDGSMELDSETDADPSVFEQRMAKLNPLVERALSGNLGDAGKIRAVAGFAREKAEAGNLESALNALDTLEKLLVAAATSKPNAPAVKPVVPSASGASAAGGATAPEPTSSKPARRLAPVWISAKENVDEQLSAMQLKMRRYGDEDLNAIADEMTQALAGYRTAMNIALQNYDDSTPANRASMAQRALAVVQDHQKRIPADPWILAADSNPFKIQVSLQTTLGSALNEIAAALQA